MQYRTRQKLSCLISIGFSLGVLFTLWPFMAEAAEEVRIGVVIPLSGPPAKFGAIQRAALTMAAEDVNNAGGIKSLGGAKITLVFGDTRGEPDIGVTETERLITQEKVHAVLGAFQSGVGFPSSAVAERYQTPWLTFGTFDKITQRGFKYVFRAHANDTIKARTLIDGLMAIGKQAGKPIQTAVLVAENTDWGNSVSAKQKMFLEKYGAKVEYVETYPHAAPDLSSLVTKAKSYKPDLFLASSYLGDAILITRHMDDLEFHPMVYASGGGGHIQPDFFNAVGKSSDYILVATMWAPGVGKAIPWIKEENERFKTRFGTDLTEDSAGFYQAFQIVVDALNRMDKLDRKTLRDAIAATDITDINHKAMIMPYERIKFDENGQNTYATAMVVQIKDAQQYIVYPPIAADPDFKPVWPSPYWK